MQYVVAGKSMSEIVLMPVKDVAFFFNTIQLDENDANWQTFIYRDSPGFGF
jgi:hypothetical protein